MKQRKLLNWIEEVRRLCEPKAVHICDGSQEEYDLLCEQLVQKKIFVPLAKRPGSFWCRSHPDDVARVEESTFICSKSSEDAGPTNNWKDPGEMHQHLLTLFKGCMHGRTLYVIPFCMGPLHSKFARIGVQITDSPYVVINMRIMTHMGKEVLEELKSHHFIPCLHSVGVPIHDGEEDGVWPCNPAKRVIAHFPEEPSIWSYGSGYGGNALLGKKCLALRIASVLGREEGWMAEHMLILSITNPEGEKRYITAAFPSACGKTNLAMLQSPLPGWEIRTVGDDIAWMHFEKDGRLHAINPETGFFGVAPGTSFASNPSAMRAIEKNTIFTNVGLTPDGDVWWEGMTPTPPPQLTDWLGKSWTPGCGRTAAHPNARFTAPISQCPVLDSAWQDAEGVPISAIIFGGRRPSLIPLVIESFSWAHGVFLGAGLSSERTAASNGEVGVLRRDPFAMLPFCGYHMGDYFNHWLQMGRKTDAAKLPRIYHVNWFRKDAAGKYLWPGFGENMRVLKWIFERVSKKNDAEQTPIGWIPTKEALDVSCLQFPPNALDELLAIDQEGLLKELDDLENYFKLFGNKLPKELSEQLSTIRRKLL